VLVAVWQQTPRRDRAPGGACGRRLSLDVSFNHMRIPSPEGRTALLTLHSHGDRSFLDDREIALVSGDLTAAGIGNDLVHAVLDGEAGDGFARLVDALSDYDVIGYERVWNRDVIERLRALLPHATFIWWQGEHALESPPADWVCIGRYRDAVPQLLLYLRGRSPLPPVEARCWSGETFVSVDGAVQVSNSARPFHPNLRPRFVTPEALPSFRTFSVAGNQGCPYQADVRNNPLYEGITVAAVGKGCAFCTTGYEYVYKPNQETAASVLEQIVYVRMHAPELQHLVLLDQNPFGYLPELLRSLREQQIGGFTLMLETRADWFLRSRERFERALDEAKRGGIVLAPFLVGIENFSQAELDRFNKGTTAEANIHFVETLREWATGWSDAITLEHASFGFILFTPWTTMEDLQTNYEAIARVRLTDFRGSILVSRVRLYPDTSLYYLAERDGLLADAFDSEEEDNSARYGYYPFRPWRYLDPRVAHFSRIAAQATRETGSRDQLRLFRCLLDAFAETEDVTSVTVANVLDRYRAAPDRSRSQSGLRKLLRPLQLHQEFAAGWHIRQMSFGAEQIELHLEHAANDPFTVRLKAATASTPAPRSKRFAIRSSCSLSEAQRAAFDIITSTVAQNDV
jgi:hypothetical protein